MRWLVAWACAIAVFPVAARAGETVVLPLIVHVAAREGRDVVPEGFVAERVARANAIYAPYGVRFEVRSTVKLDSKHAALETRADRDALGAYETRGAIDWFVVESLRDVDDETQMRRGVHWRSRTQRGAHFVIVSSIAGPNVLAHELGHYLGNREHSEVAGNLMSYTPAEGLPFLDAAQQAKLRSAVAAYLASGELKASE
jgi:hypothetical protein